jgi:glycosyltransferase involved in cell wall biosynthesis
MVNTKIRIAYIIDKVNVGGTENQLRYLIGGLDLSRFDITLYVLRDTTEPAVRFENIDARVLDLGSLASFKGVRKVVDLTKQLRKSRCQIVQTFFQDATIVGAIAGRMAGAKTLISIRDNLFWATPLNLAVYRAIAHLGNLVLVNSSSVRERIKPLFSRKRIEVIYNGIPSGSGYSGSTEARRALRKELGCHQDTPIAVIVSNCNRAVKRLDVFIDSIPLILRESSASFVIVGDGKLRPALQRRVADLNMDPFVRFLGHRDDIEYILAGCDIAVNTSDSEGLSNSILEAMRAGLPVVASDVPGNREIVEDQVTGLLFTPGDSKALAEKIVEILRHRALASALGRAGSKVVESVFTIDAMVNKHVALYKSILHN